MLNKLNLKNKDVVKIKNTNSPVDGQICEVIGKSSSHIIDFYIVWLQTPIEAEGFVHQAASIPESCMDRI